MAKKLTFGNFKGGVGKTTSACMTAILLQERGFRVLLVDFDPQADTTQFMVDAFRYELAADYKSVYEGMSNFDLEPTVISLSEKLSLIPSGSDLLDFNSILSKVTKTARPGSQYFFLDSLISRIEENYDYILFDVPPTQNEYNYNALVASDYVIAVLQTQSKAFNQTKKYINFIKDIQQIMVHEDFNYPPVQLLGVLTYLQKVSSGIDKSIMKQAEELYGDLLFKSKILERERVKRYDEEGLKLDNMDMHDKDVFAMYDAVVEEILTKVGDEDGEK